MCEDLWSRLYSFGRVAFTHHFVVLHTLPRLRHSLGVTTNDCFLAIMFHYVSLGVLDASAWFKMPLPIPQTIQLEPRPWQEARSHPFLLTENQVTNRFKLWYAFYDGNAYCYKQDNCFVGTPPSTTKSNDFLAVIQQSTSQSGAACDSTTSNCCSNTSRRRCS